MQKVLVSSCLLGERVRYNGQDAKISNDIIDRWLKEERVVRVCPELTADLGVPRPPAEIIGTNGFAVLDGFGVVVNDRGTDVTRQLIAGAHEVLQAARLLGIRVAVLKDGSPSCGRTYIHNGQFLNIKKRGEVGVTVALLQRNGIAVFNEHQVAEANLRVEDLETNLRVGA
jgi:uncharacterized protein YbbK (DUF523 family)